MLPRPICFRLLTQPIRFAFSLALDSAGSSMAARMAMIAITTRSSISVNPALRNLCGRVILFGIRTGKSIALEVIARFFVVYARNVNSRLHSSDGKTIL
jgi:multisubunit Na+/H+ antiporter MnhF subunit